MQQDIITSWLIITKINTAAKKRQIQKAECIPIYPHNVFIINEHLFLLLLTLCCSFFLFTPLWLLSAQLGWKLLECRRGSSLCQGQRDMFWLFTYTLIQVLIMVVLSARKKRTGKSEKPQTEYIRDNTAAMRAHTHTDRHCSTPKDERMIHIRAHLQSWRQIQSITAASHPILLTNTHTQSRAITFISYAAQQVFGCRSTNIDSHFDSTYSLIYLLVHLLTHSMSKKCQMLWLTSE